MKKLPQFEKFIPVGFSTNSGSKYSINSPSNIDTGYNMKAIIGPIMELSKCIAEQAVFYNEDDNPSHTTEDYINEAKKHVIQKIDEVCEGYDINENRDPKSIRNEYTELKKSSKQTLEDIWTRKYKIGNPKELDKEGLISDILRSKYGDKYVDAAFESEDHIYEDADYEYDPQEHAERLERKKETNLRRYRAAQDRGDNYAIKYYELRMRLDDIESEKLKTNVAIKQLQKKFNK